MKKRFVIFSFIFLISGILASQTLVRHVDAATFKKLLDQKKYVLIDLRTSEEILDRGIIEGAMQIDYFDPESEKRIRRLDRNASYLIYCAGGGRSSECADLMETLGFKEVVELEKGYDDWKKKGFPTVKN